MSSKEDERVELRVPSADLRRWRATAGAEGIQLSAWIRRLCNEAAVDQETIDAIMRKKADREVARPRSRRGAQRQ